MLYKDLQFEYDGNKYHLEHIWIDPYMITRKCRNAWKWDVPKYGLVNPPRLISVDDATNDEENNKFMDERDHPIPFDATVFEAISHIKKFQKT